MIDKSKTKFLVFLVSVLIAINFKGQELTRKEYIKKYAPLAVKQMQLHQIQVNVIRCNKIKLNKIIICVSGCFLWQILNYMNESLY